MKSGVTFTDTCKPIDLPCEVGDLYVDPCNCTTYYQCYQSYSDPLLRHCATGTAWNDEKSNCDAEEKVYINGICSKFKPWNRCERIHDLSDEDMDRVRDKCVDVVIDGGEGAEGEGPANYTGDIVAGIVGGLILLALVIVIIVLIKRRKGKDNFLRRFTGVKQPVDNPGYSDPDPQLYDTIDSVRMRESQKTTVDKPHLPTRPISTLPYKEQPLAAPRPDSTISNQPDTSLQYDNNYDVTGSYSPMVTPRNSEIRDYENLCPPRKQIPSEYSRPYMEPINQLPVPVSKDNMTTGSDVAVPSAHEYVDFGHYDTDYSLATDLDKEVK